MTQKCPHPLYKGLKAIKCIQFPSKRVTLEMFLMTDANREGSDLPADSLHSDQLFLICHCILLLPLFFSVDSEDYKHTAQIHIMIWVFLVRISNKGPFSHISADIHVLT